MAQDVLAALVFVDFFLVDAFCVLHCILHEHEGNRQFTLCIIDRLAVLFGKQFSEVILVVLYLLDSFLHALYAILHL